MRRWILQQTLDYTHVDRDSFFAQWSALHGNVEISGVVKGWLTISFQVIKPLRKARITPNHLTLSGLICAVVLWPLAKSYWAIPLLALSLLGDGLDGSLALITESTSRWGAMLDSLVDRLSEGFWALAFYQLGVDFRLLFLAWGAALTQEYIRARAGGLGFKEIGVVTICERPVRASLLCIALVAYIIKLHIVGDIALAWAIMQVISLAHLSLSAFRRLQLH